MKKIILISLLLFSINAIGQSALSTDSVTGAMYSTGIVRVDSVNADQLYRKVKMWVAESFKSAKDVIQLDDKDGRVMIVRGMGRAYIHGMFGEDLDNGTIEFTLKVECKDERYKYLFSDFMNITSYGTMPSEKYRNGKKQTDYNKRQISDLVQRLTDGLKVAMNSAQSGVKSDW